jgi:hypothetical protein
VGEDQRDAIEYCAVTVCLGAQSIQGIHVALDLNTHQMTIDEGDVSAALTVLEAKLVEYEGVRIAMVSQ